MEIKPATIDAFIKKPDPAIRSFLIYGQDEGLVRERGKKIALNFVETLDDPFCYVEMTSAQLDEDPARLRDEIEAISMMGGTRVIRVRDITNRHTKVIESVLDANFSQSILVLEGADLKKTGSLPKLFSKEKTSASLACYHDSNQNLNSLIQEVLTSKGYQVDQAASEYLRSNLGSDRAISRQELEKLALYLGEERKQVTLEDAKEMVGDSSEDNIFDVIDATLLGKMDDLEKALNKAFFAGESPVTFMRLIQGQLKQLHKAACFIDRGSSVADAVKRAGIPFFNQQKAQVQIGRKKAPHFAQAIEISLNAEIETKTTGFPAEAICRRALLRIAMASRAR
ncbi:DNA polymerase III subunit delta [Sneathiella sp. P13V-1]|uniref:DNA polymerase III subunit delta n=1 Tax=Sneathiella sp. P13V-1 TaxID=2697366 RepID=UPI00187B842E|nr:DNA polymerase III subunit delta [Sneathiella sp. P13V-1]MBE7636088.1 DNA polymerase III subunit delta [Sneathiella sp. P13V-1]